MTEAELEEIVRSLRRARSDVGWVEAKRSQRALPKSVRETLSAFSNTAGGGAIVLGLDENSGFRAVGLDDAPQVAAAVADLCRQNMEPPLQPLIEIHAFEGADLVVVEVPELDPAQKPCFYKGAGINNGSYVRVGDGDHRLTSYEVQMMVASRGQPREDEQPVADASLTDLDRDALLAFANRLLETRPTAFRDLPLEDVLRRTKVLVPADDADARLVPSVAGLLSFGVHPQQYFPQVNLTFVHYATADGGPLPGGERFLDNRTIDGPIPLIVRDTLEIVRRNMTRRAVIRGAGREDVWEYPETALREAIVNALVHRDFSSASRGTQVQVEMYPDHLVIRNPGGLFGPVRVDQLGEEGISSSRNAVLLKVLEDTVIPGESRAVCENRGSGIRAMIQALRNAGMTLPEFSDRISSFQVSFPNHTLLSPEVVAWLESLEQEGLTDSQVTALALLRQGRVMTNATYRTDLGVDSRVATSELQDLVGRELVAQTGDRRWATYRLSPSATSPGGRARLAPADRRNEILRSLGSRTMSRAELSVATGLNDQTVRRWLRILRDEGRVEITGKLQSKQAKYHATTPVVDELHPKLPGV